jgi:hypothetical protein
MTTPAKRCATNEKQPCICVYPPSRAATHRASSSPSSAPCRRPASASTKACSCCARSAASGYNGCGSGSTQLPPLHRRGSGRHTGLTVEGCRCCQRAAAPTTAANTEILPTPHCWWSALHVPISHGLCCQQLLAAALVRHLAPELADVAASLSVVITAVDQGSAAHRRGRSSRCLRLDDAQRAGGSCHINSSVHVRSGRAAGPCDQRPPCGPIAAL